MPYRLPEPTDRPAELGRPAPGPAPSAFWLRKDRPAPGMAVGSCDDEPDSVVEQVLDVLADGPQDDERVGGRSTAIPPESSLTLVGLDDGTAEVEFSAPAAISADRLPVAVGQIALAVGSAPVGSVQLVDDGEPVPVPLPGGALTTAPVHNSRRLRQSALGARAVDRRCRVPRGLTAPGSSSRPGAAPRP